MVYVCVWRIGRYFSGGTCISDDNSQAKDVKSDSEYYERKEGEDTDINRNDKTYLCKKWTYKRIL